MSSKYNSKLAIISGSGVLPRLLSEELLSKKIDHTIVYFSNSPPSWALSKIETLFGKIEKIGSLFKKLKSKNVKNIVFAGSLDRPKLNFEVADQEFLKLLPDILPAMKAGDDKLLSLIVNIFKDEGFEVIGSQEILPSLLPKVGVLTKNHPSKQDEKDIARACNIVSKLSDADIGQASVVSNGLCYGVETIQGTEVLLRFVENNSQLNDQIAKGQSGVFFKNIKNNQSRLIDFPVIGPETVRQVSRAGLNGIGIVHNNVFILDMSETIKIANRNGLFISVIAE